MHGNAEYARLVGRLKDYRAGLPVHVYEGVARDAVTHGLGYAEAALLIKWHGRAPSADEVNRDCEEMRREVQR